MYMVVPDDRRRRADRRAELRRRARRVSRRGHGIAREVATQLAIAITQARLHERLQRQAEELEDRVRSDASYRHGSSSRRSRDRRRAEVEADARQPGQERVPLAHEPRAAHAAERDPRLRPAPRDGRARRRTSARSVEQILQAGRHLLGLINEVLDISRIEAGRMTLSLEPVAGRRVAPQPLDLVRPPPRPRAIALPFEAPAGERSRPRRPPAAPAGAAEPAVERGEVQPRRAARSPSPATHVADGRLRIRVTRHRPWASRRDSSTRLFTPFERLGAERSDVEGTGLGLALSQAPRRGDGRHDRRREPVGRGSTFSVELPPTAPSARSARAARPTAADDGDARARVTVLYIEDNLANLRLVERIMDGGPSSRCCRRCRAASARAGPRAPAGPDPARPAPARHGRRGGARAGCATTRARATSRW